MTPRARLAGATKRMLHGAGHYRRRLARDHFPGVLVLAYHGVRADGPAPRGLPFAGLHVTVGELDAHCRLLAETCQPIRLAQWAAARAGGPPLPPRPVLLTFDDGYHNLLSHGLPVLRRHRLPAVVFGLSGPSAAGRLTWYDALARRQGEAAVEAVKSASAEVWRAAVEASPRAAAQDPCRLLSPAELRDLAASGWCEVGGHTATHPILARLPLAEQGREIDDNRRELAQWTGTDVSAFAYPNGRPGLDYDRATVGAVAAAGYSFAFTTTPGWAKAASPTLELPRFLMLAGVTASELAHRLCYSWRKPEGSG